MWVSIDKFKNTLFHLGQVYFGEVLVLCLCKFVQTVNVFDVSAITLNKCFFVVHDVLVGWLFESEYLCRAEIRVVNYLNKI